MSKTLTHGKMMTSQELTLSHLSGCGVRHPPDIKLKTMVNR